MDRGKSNFGALEKRSDRSSLVGVKRIHAQSLLIERDRPVDGRGEAVESSELASRLWSLTELL